MYAIAEKTKATQQTTLAKSEADSPTCLSQSHNMSSDIHLQRMIGNHADQRLLQGSAEECNSRLTRTISPYFGHDFSRIPVRLPTAGPVQTKLAINKPGDEFEQEADQVAEQVMRVPEPQMQHACGGGCPKFRNTNRLSMRTEQVQAAGNGASEIPSIVHEVLSSPAQPLDPTTRSFLEPRFGLDFSHVRVHDDSRADQAARSIGALAYTVGSDVVLSRDRPNSRTAAGRRLLAHELAHVAQQQGDEIQRLPVSALGDLESFPGARVNGDGMIMRQEVEPRSREGRETETPPITRSCPVASPSCDIPRETFAAGRRLTPAEVARRRTAVQRLIDRTRSSTPLAAANLQHWLDGTGSLRSMPPEPFQRSDSGVERELRRVHWPVIRRGILRRLRDRGDPETLGTVGTVRTIHYWHSISASPTSSNATERDLSIALGTYAVTSYVTVRSTGTGADILSWCIQVCDRYDWNVGAIAPVPIPGELGRALADTPHAPGRVLFPHGREAPTAYYISDDDWFRDLETSGGGRHYDVRTEVFSMPGMPSRIL